MSDDQVCMICATLVLLSTIGIPAIIRALRGLPEE